jgi:hypothetical protein
MDQLNTVIVKYLKFVFAWDLDDDGNHRNENTAFIDEYLRENFSYSASFAFDIVEWYEGIGDYSDIGHYARGSQGTVSTLMDATTICQAIRAIALDDDPMDYRYITPEMVLRNYTQVYVHDMSVEDLKALLL